MDTDIRRNKFSLSIGVVVKLWITNTRSITYGELRFDINVHSAV